LSILWDGSDISWGPSAAYFKEASGRTSLGQGPEIFRPDQSFNGTPNARFFYITLNCVIDLILGIPPDHPLFCAHLLTDANHRGISVRFATKVTEPTDCSNEI
jgi:hypothetical protein